MVEMFIETFRTVRNWANAMYTIAWCSSDTIYNIK